MDDTHCSLRCLLFAFVLHSIEAFGKPVFYKLRTREGSVEKGFNDNELADIMNEIESLEQEFAEEVEEPVVAEETVAKKDQTEEPVMEEPATEEIVAEQDQGEEPVEDPMPETAMEEDVAEEVVATQGQDEGPIDEPVMGEDISEEITAEQDQVEESMEEPVMEEELFEEHAEPAEVVAQTEVTQEAAQEVTRPNAPLRIVSTSIKEEMTEVMSELSGLPVGEVQPVNTSNENITEDKDGLENLHHLRSYQSTGMQSTGMPSMNKGTSGTLPNSSARSSMSFNVSGDMTVDLSFNVGGAAVEICVNETEGLVITMEGGGKFILPLQTHSMKNVG